LNQQAQKSVKFSFTHRRLHEGCEVLKYRKQTFFEVYLAINYSPQELQCYWSTTREAHILSKHVGGNTLSLQNVLLFHMSVVQSWTIYLVGWVFASVLNIKWWAHFHLRGLIYKKMP